MELNVTFYELIAAGILVQADKSEVLLPPSDDNYSFLSYVLADGYTMDVIWQHDEISWFKANYVQIIQDAHSPLCWCVQLEGANEEPNSHPQHAHIKIKLYKAVDLNGNLLDDKGIS